MTAPTLLLFDIDGTLMSAGGAGMRAIDRAVAHRFGIAKASHGVSPDGKTDPQIIRETLRSRGIAAGAETAALDELVPLYERYLADEMPSSPARLLPGVRELLDAVDGVPIGLLTGNIEAGARIKLDRFGLAARFRFGAYGSDDESRNELPPIAVARAEQVAGIDFGLGPHVRVIGDTPRDVECALAHGLTAIAVATGRRSADELRAAGAHVVLDDLADTPGVLNALGLSD